MNSPDEILFLFVNLRTPYLRPPVSFLLLVWFHWYSQVSQFPLVFVFFFTKPNYFYKVIYIYYQILYVVQLVYI